MRCLVGQGSDTFVDERSGDHFNLLVQGGRRQYIDKSDPQVVQMVVDVIVVDCIVVIVQPCRRRRLVFLLKMFVLDQLFQGHSYRQWFLVVQTSNHVFP